MHTFALRKSPLFSITIALLLLSFLIPLTSITEANAAGRSWAVRKKIKTGEKISIQTMYAINRHTCEWDAEPPDPKFSSPPKFGKVSFKTGKTKPRQCPSKSIDARFADYTAGHEAGTDTFRIRWHSTSGPIFSVTYIIRVR